MNKYADGGIEGMSRRINIGMFQLSQMSRAFS